MKTLFFVVGIVVGAVAAGMVPVIRNDDLSTALCKERAAYLRSETYRIVVVSGSDDYLPKAVRENYERHCGWKHLFGWIEAPLPVQSGSGLGRKGGS